MNSRNLPSIKREIARSNTEEYFITAVARHKAQSDRPWRREAALVLFYAYLALIFEITHVNLFRPSGRKVHQAVIYHMHAAPSWTLNGGR